MWEPLGPPSQTELTAVYPAGESRCPLSQEARLPPTHHHNLQWLLLCVVIGFPGLQDPLYQAAFLKQLARDRWGEQGAVALLWQLPRALSVRWHSLGLSRQAQSGSITICQGTLKMPRSLATAGRHEAQGTLRSTVGEALQQRHRASFLSPFCSISLQCGL